MWFRAGLCSRRVRQIHGAKRLVEKILKLNIQMQQAAPAQAQPPTAPISTEPPETNLPNPASV